MNEENYKVYENLHKTIDTKEEERYIYPVTRAREKKIRELGTTRCIKVMIIECLVERVRLKKGDRITFTNNVMKT